MLVRRENTEKRGLHAGNPVQQTHGLGTTFYVLGAIHTDSGEEECFPIVVCLDGADLFEDVLKAWHLIAIHHHRVEFGADFLPVHLQLRRPGKGLCLVNGWIPVHRNLGNETFQ